MLDRYAYLWYHYRRRVKGFVRAAQQSRARQQATLLAKLRRHAESDFGREHGFGEIRSVADFRRRVPLTDYEYHRPYVERVMRGERQAMFGPGTELLMFALTSGTTGEPKYIPITREFFHEYRQGWQIWGVAAYHDHRDLLRKQTLQLTSDWQQHYTSAGIPCGNISGLAAETRPLVARRIFFLPRHVTKIATASAKHYTALRLALASRRVGMVVTANPTTLVELARRADRERELLIRDVFDGTLSEHVDVRGEVRAALRPWTRRRQRSRARELEQIIERSGHLYPRDVWPQMTTLAVWTGGAVGAFLPQVREYYGDLAVRDHGLSASEGRMTIPLADGTSAGLLDFAHHFFEFIPEAEHGKPEATVLEAHELVEGERYYIVLTTSSGMYRYDIHDVVRCVGYEGQAPLLEFLNKGAHFSNMTGEKLSEFQAITAVKTGLAELKLPVELFTLAPVSQAGRCYYALLHEPGLSAAQQQQLAERVDAQLAELNWEYREKRASGRLGPVEFCEIPAGTWARLRAGRAAARGNFEEYKHPCLVGDLQFVDRLLNEDQPERKLYVS